MATESIAADLISAKHALTKQCALNYSDTGVLVNKVRKTKHLLVVEQLVLGHVVVGHWFAELVNLLKKILSDL